MGYTVVIPSRYASTRLPGKPLLEIAGKPMVQHVHERALESSAERVVVATDDERIAAAVEGFGGAVVMTSPDHVSGTDRIEEVCRTLGLSDSDIVVNVQGDEPLIPAAVIDQVAENLALHATAGIATLCEAVASDSDYLNPNVVKVVSDSEGYALYFSRAPIPWDRDGFAGGDEVAVPAMARRHLGIYAYRVSLLRQFVNWAPAPLELLESLEQLRALANGSRIHVADSVMAVPPGVDTQADLDAVRALLNGER
ncbi:MAG: 3-deoxy-manno-octulosonate cytidylyltransferase [Halieaceae bacterium]